VTVAVALPAGIEILAFTLATFGLLLLRLTTIPLAGAIPLRVTVTFAVSPVSIDVGETCTAVSTGGGDTTVSVAVRFTAPKVAVNMACPRAFPGTTKATVALLTGTVTLAGTGETVGLLLVRLTTIPPAGAAPLRVTVAVDVPPRTIWNWLSVRVVSTGGGGATVSVAVRLTPASVAVIMVCPAAIPGMLKVLFVLPAKIVRLAGTVATWGLLLVRLTGTPPAGAIPLSVTVAVDVPPRTI
jgi:hypothetical protein